MFLSYHKLVFEVIFSEDHLWNNWPLPPVSPYSWMDWAIIEFIACWKQSLLGGSDSTEVCFWGIFISSEAKKLRKKRNEKRKIHCTETIRKIFWRYLRNCQDLIHHRLLWWSIDFFEISFLEERTGHPASWGLPECCFIRIQFTVLATQTHGGHHSCGPSSSCR